VGKVFGLTRERIRQIEFQALKKLSQKHRKAALEIFWQNN
jgi:DNA-directed RNA polymerase sigma subunit (sigma70/sigma32)